jgi:DNA-binding CsgD family transcriptional regulator
MDADWICPSTETLTPREREVMDHVVSGFLNKEIASKLGITERTVKVHRARAKEKMGAKSSAELIKKLLAVQFSGKEQKANALRNMRPENAAALKLIADLLQTTPEAFLEHLVFWHCRHEIDTRGMQYLAETVHAWEFPSKAEAQSASKKFEELIVRYNLQTKRREGFRYSYEVRPLFAVPNDKSPLDLGIKGWQLHVEQFAGGNRSPADFLASRHRSPKISTRVRSKG